MSVQYSGGLEVYKACERVFDDLYKGSLKFKKLIDRNKFASVTLCDGKVYVGEDLLTISSDCIQSMFDGVRDEEYNDTLDNISEIQFTDVYLYKDAYNYLDEVTIDYDEYKGITIMAGADNVRTFPSLDKLFKPKYTDDSNWRSFKLNASLCDILVSVIDWVTVQAGDCGSILRIYMDGDTMKVALIYHYKEPYVVSAEDDETLYSMGVGLLGVIKGFGGPVKEVLCFTKTAPCSMSVRKHCDGEYTLVVE